MGGGGRPSGRSSVEVWGPAVWRSGCDSLATLGVGGVVVMPAAFAAQPRFGVGERCCEAEEG